MAQSNRESTRRFAVVVLLAVVMTGCAEPLVRPQRSTEQLLKERQALDEQLATARTQMLADNLRRIKAEHDEFTAGRIAAAPIVDLLVISGGGDWGAFGAGFLKGWGRVSGPMSRPQFDAVTGVSTGALIAPFAFLGDEASIDEILNIYRNPKSDWAKPRGLLTFLGGAESYAETVGLERDIRDAMTAERLRRIAEGGAGGRILAVNTTNLDTSEMRVWDIVAEARRAVETGDASRVPKILLASSAVPGAFAPREIDGWLFADGGVTGNVLWGGRAGRNEGFEADWKTRYPDVPIPKIRYWVIFNNEVRWPPAVVQPKWSSVLANSTTTSTRAATLNSIRHLFTQSRLAKLAYNADVEVRFVAVPDGWIAPKPGVFGHETMNALADLGEKMGADPQNWRTELP